MQEFDLLRDEAPQTTRHADARRGRGLEFGQPLQETGFRCAKMEFSARSMNQVTPASRAPGVSSLGIICEVSASTSAASAAPNKV